jgi:hypothetical protein
MQLEAKRKDNFCLRAVQKFVFCFLIIKYIFKIANRTYEDILEMNMISNKNANATIDDEHKFQVVCLEKYLFKIKFFYF